VEFERLKKHLPHCKSAPAPSVLEANWDGTTVGKTFLKWAGNKQKLLPRIMDTFGDTGNKTLVDAFAGSASLFIGTEGYDRYIINDINGDLIDLYTFLSNNSTAIDLIAIIESLFVDANNNEDAYYRLRSEFNSLETSVRKSALFVYLNKFGFNGLCRYNQSGGFNVPYGQKNTPSFASICTDMVRFYRKCQETNVTFVSMDFREVVANLPDNCDVYFDPPYLPLANQDGTFTSYAKTGFSEQDHRDLAALCVSLSEAGHTVVLSNHNSPLVSQIYETDNSEVRLISVLRSISSDGNTRGRVSEVLIRYPGSEPIILGDEHLGYDEIVDETNEE
jgi:DNA adenine methylase